MKPSLPVKPKSTINELFALVDELSEIELPKTMKRIEIVSTDAELSFEISGLYEESMAKIVICACGTESREVIA